MKIDQVRHKLAISEPLGGSQDLDQGIGLGSGFKV